MNRFIIIWELNYYPDMNGGKNYLFAKDEIEMIKIIDIISKRKNLIYFQAYELSHEIKFKPIETVTKWKIIE